MRKILAFLFIYMSLLAIAQEQNPFAAGDDQSMMSNATKENPREYPIQQYDNPNAAPALANDPGNPGDPVPIDDYLPLLVIIAAGLIIYRTYGRKSLS